jgi:hypothetical protein
MHDSEKDRSRDENNEQEDDAEKRIGDRSIGKVPHSMRAIETARLLVAMLRSFCCYCFLCEMFIYRGKASSKSLGLLFPEKGNL